MKAIDHEKIIDRFTLWLVSNTILKLSTIRLYTDIIRTANKRLDTSKPTQGQINEYIRTLNSFDKHQTAVRNAFIMYLISQDKARPTPALIKEYGEHIHEPLQKPRRIPYANIDKTELQTRINKLGDKKEKLILAIAYGSAARIREIITLKEEQIIYRPEHSDIHLRLKGKGGKNRDVFIHGEYWPAISELLTGQKKAYLFLPMRRIKKIKSPMELELLINRYYQTLMRNLKNTGAAWTFHHLRSTRITNAEDIGIAKELAGHSNIQTTLRYRPISPERIRLEMLKDGPATLQ